MNKSYIKPLSQDRLELLKLINPNLTDTTVTSFEVTVLRRDKNILGVSHSSIDLPDSAKATYCVRVEELTQCALQNSIDFEIDRLSFAMNGKIIEPTQTQIDALKCFLVKQEQEFLMRKVNLS